MTVVDRSVEDHPRGARSTPSTAGLFAAEFRRFASRLLVRVVTGLLLLAIVVSTVIVLVRAEFQLHTLPDVLMGTSFVLVIVGWVFGASFVGAEWHAGTITTLLTWEPRRGRVMTAKLVAVLVSVFLVTLAIQGLLTAGLTIDAVAAGSTAGVDAGTIATAVGVAVRVALLSTFFAGFGFGLASIGRNTAAALGVGFGYIVIVENIVRGFRPGWTAWLLTDNAGLFVIGDPSDFAFGRSTVGAGIYLGAVALLIVLASAAVFRARDVA